MVLILLALFVQIVLLRLSRLKCPMPLPIRTLFLDGLGRLCCMKQQSRGGYTKSSLSLPIVAGGPDGQEVDHFEMGDHTPGEVLATDKSRHEWFTLAVLLNRVTFLIHMAVCLIVLLWAALQINLLVYFLLLLFFPHQLKWKASPQFRHISRYAYIIKWSFFRYFLCALVACMHQSMMLSIFTIGTHHYHSLIRTNAIHCNTIIQ